MPFRLVRRRFSSAVCVVFAAHVLLVQTQDSCTANNDFGIVFNGSAAFTVSQSNGTCLCPGGFVGSGQRLTALDRNPAVQALNATVASQASLIAAQAATISSLTSTVATLQSQLAAQSQTATALSPQYNLAYNKTVTASTYYFDWANWGKERLVDGRVDTAFVTSNNGTLDWVQVDLGAQYRISQIVIVNRWDCCQDRLGVFHVFAASFDMSATASPATLMSTAQYGTTRYYNEFVDKILSIAVAPTTPVRYVRLQLSVQSWINVGELQVFAGFGPATSCQQTKTLYPAAPSGAYPIDPDGPGPQTPLGVYCDMAADTGGWTMAYRMAGNSQQQYQPVALNTNDLSSVGGTISQVAKLSDAFINALNPAEVWSICGGRQTIYRRNPALSWSSNFGTTTSCSYSRNTYSLMKKSFDDHYEHLIPSLFTNNGACGGVYFGNSWWGVLIGIMNPDNTYMGCYDGCNLGTANTSTCTAAPSQYATAPLGNWGATGGGSGYVLMR